MKFCNKVNTRTNATFYWSEIFKIEEKFLKSFRIIPPQPHCCKVLLWKLHHNAPKNKQKCEFNNYKHLDVSNKILGKGILDTSQADATWRNTCIAMWRKRDRQFHGPVNNNLSTINHREALCKWDCLIVYKYLGLSKHPSQQIFPANIYHCQKLLSESELCRLQMWARKTYIAHCWR